MKIKLITEYANYYSNNVQSISLNFDAFDATKSFRSGNITIDGNVIPIFVYGDDDDGIYADFFSDSNVPILSFSLNFDEINVDIWGINHKHIYRVPNDDCLMLDLYHLWNEVMPFVFCGQGLTAIEENSDVECYKELEIPVRAKNVLESLNCRTIGDFKGLTLDRLLRTKHCSKITARFIYHEVKNKLGIVIPPNYSNAKSNLISKGTIKFITDPIPQQPPRKPVPSATRGK